MVGGQREAYSAADPVRGERFVDVFPIRRPSFDFRGYRTRSFWQPLVAGRKNGHLLDADLRFFAAMMIGLGFIFFLTTSKLEVYRP